MTRAQQKRKRWHDTHALDEILEKLKFRARNTRNASNTTLDDDTHRYTSIHIVRDCDLRATLPEKALSVHKFANWTAFVNRAGTLVHMVPKDGDFHIRIPLFYSVKALSDKRIEHMMQSYAWGRLK